MSVYWRRGEIWARKNTTYITEADGWRETQFQRSVVLGASLTIFIENNNRKSIKNIKPIQQNTVLPEWGSHWESLKRRRSMNWLLNDFLLMVCCRLCAGDAGVLWRGRDHHAGDDWEQHAGGAHQGEFHFILTIFKKFSFQDSVSWDLARCFRLM